MRVKCLGKFCGVNMPQQMEGEDEAIYYHQVYKQMLYCGNLEVSLVESFSGNTDLYKILTSEAFIVMILTKPVVYTIKL